MFTHHSGPFRRILFNFFVLSYLVVLLIASDSIRFGLALDTGNISLVFLITAWLCYGIFYLIPAIATTGIAYWILKKRTASSRISKVLLYTTAITTTGLTSLLLYANAKIFSLYGMFINGFILNLLMTPGGIESLGGSSESDVGFAMIAIGFFLLQAALLWVAYLIAGHIKKYLNKTKKPSTKWQFGSALLAFTLLTVGVHFGYAADSYSTGKLVPLAETVPFFHPISARHLFASLGLKARDSRKIEIKGHLQYPAQPIQYKQPAKPYNIVWLVSESWRADMLDPEIMPSTWRFAQTAQNFTDNYSGGNGTRMGIFSMFMGIPGNYWFSFMKEHRGAAILDVLQKQGYQIEFYTSARFSYPEFDKTIFSNMPPEHLHELPEPGEGWQRDRINVGKLLEFIDKRDTTKPFFTFMFFESPHARYHFPPESVIRTPYRDDINYATLSKDELRADIIPIKNRYINAVHHLDSQFERIFSYLEQNKLLDSTIVIALGDHGEEFMEHGYWGHNSTFVDQQIRTPLVMWLPGMAANVHQGMTSHMDIVPTLMPLLGVTNPSSDYAIGYNLMANPVRKSTYVSDWSRIVYIDKQVKITQPVSIQGYGGERITTATDEAIPATEQDRWMKEKQAALLQTVKDLTKFLDKSK